MRSIRLSVTKLLRPIVDFVLDRDSSETKDVLRAEELLELLSLHHQNEQLVVVQYVSKQHELEVARKQLLLFEEQLKNIQIVHNVDLVTTAIELQLSLERQVQQCELELEELSQDMEAKRLLLMAKKQEIEKKFARITTVDTDLQVIAIGERISKLEANTDKESGYGIS